MLFDGAMGTMIQAANPPPEDYEGHPECNVLLNLTRPDLIEGIHLAYLEAGADIITTNSFGASFVALKDYELAHLTLEINRAAVAVARKAADAFFTKARPRFVAGEIGPTAKIPTLGHISFKELFTSYEQQIGILVEGGVDLLLIATCQDILQAKAAAAAAREVLAKRGAEVPLLISVTIENVGTMLLGSDILAALAALEPYAPFAFGLNCATGPEMMEDHLKQLSLHSPFALLCRPNAGVPENVDGKPVYPLSPDEFANRLMTFIDNFGVAFVGGCCGTTPEHIKALASRIKGHESKVKGPGSPLSFQLSAFSSHVSSLFSAVSLDQEPRPFIIAEQTNVNGSRMFKELFLKEDYDGMAAIAKEAAKGAHAVDVCLAYPGRDEVHDIRELIPRLVRIVDAPIMIDSTNADAVEAALGMAPGRCLINSINLEDGGLKANKILELAKRFGAAVVCLTIDEEGMARTAEKKMAIAKRLHELALSYGLRTGDLLFDPLTFTIASGEVSLANAAIETLEGIRLIKKNIKGARISLGVSNISFGLPSTVRAALNAIFLQKALDAGLDAAIINPSRILRLSQISKQERELASHLIENDDSKGPPLTTLLGYYEKKSEIIGIPLTHTLSPQGRGKRVRGEQYLRQKILDGDKSELQTLLDAACKKKPAAQVIDTILLPAMQEVGKLFANGKLPLPFVLQSAEVMRSAIDLLASRLTKEQLPRRGTMILATVRGDVHDIGKNLVDIIISNNGFSVINLGIRQPIGAIIKAAQEHKAAAIGLSGLLVSSTEIMREDLEEMSHLGISIPVLVGGAALTQKYTETVLQKAYKGKVYYCEDAFAGLKAMETIVKIANASSHSDSACNKAR